MLFVSISLYVFWFSGRSNEEILDEDEKDLANEDDANFSNDGEDDDNSNSAGREKCDATDVVLRLVEEMPKNQNFQLFMDNWFLTLLLMSNLKGMGIFVTATFRTNRLGECPLMSEKYLKKQGSGSFDYRTDKNSGLHLIKWFDNKSVVLGSTFSGVESTTTFERYNTMEKKKMKVNYLGMVLQYNQSMGGVDLVDMLISIYRTKILT